MMWMLSHFCSARRCATPRPCLTVLWLLLGMTSAMTIAADREWSLVDAAEKQKWATVRNRLDEQCDVDVAQPDGMTALHWLVYHDQTELARVVVDRGAEVRAKNRYGVEPLSLACRNGNADLVDLLLTAGADANTSLSGGETALMTASRTGILAPVQRLLQAGAEVNARERSGQTALMWAAAEGHLQVVDALLAAGADPNVQLNSGFTALFFAVREGRLPVVRRLLDERPAEDRSSDQRDSRAGASADVGDGPNVVNGPRIVQVADTGTAVDRVMQTRQRGKFTRSPLRFTPLLLAVENGHFELAEALLRWGANPNASPSGYTALHALTWIRKPIRGDGDPPPQGSGNYSSMDMVRILVREGAELDARLEDGKSGLGRFHYSGSTPFLLAAQTADVPLMQLLVKLGADTRLANVDGCTPLLAAAGVGALGDGDESAGTEEETIAAVRYLLKLGADINVVDKNGETVMHGAAYQSLAKLVSELHQQGADADIWHRRNRAGWTPLHIALGYRPGNFRPAPETIQAVKQAMTAAGVPIPDTSKLDTHRRSWGDAKLP